LSVSISCLCTFKCC